MEIRDLKITIATAASAVSTSWKNKALTWGEFVTMMSNARVTNETYREFMAMPKAEQGRVKDVGAFVGGELLAASVPKRTSANVALSPWILISAKRISRNNSRQLFKRRFSFTGRTSIISIKACTVIVS